jgi:hypothetical protein
MMLSAVSGEVMAVPQKLLLLGLKLGVEYTFLSDEM